VPQVNPQAVPSQVGVPFAGIGHAVHNVPQVLGLAFGWQIPEQSWLPGLQVPEHAAAASMQSPAHSFWPLGQVPLQLVPSQVAVPPVGTGQGTQAMPQVATSPLSTHLPVQRCIPDEQTLPPSGGIIPRSTPASAGRSTAASGPAPPPAPVPPPVPPSLVVTDMFRDRAVVHPAARTTIRARNRREANCGRVNRRDARRPWNDVESTSLGKGRDTSRF